LPFTLKSILSRQKKNYGNSNISPCKNIPNLQKNPPKEIKILQDITTLLLLISSFNTSQLQIGHIHDGHIHSTFSNKFIALNLAGFFTN
jgi:hypothetical protein